MLQRNGAVVVSIDSSCQACLELLSNASTPMYKIISAIQELGRCFQELQTEEQVQILSETLSGADTLETLSSILVTAEPNIILTLNLLLSIAQSVKACNTMVQQELPSLLVGMLLAGSELEYEVKKSATKLLVHIYQTATHQTKSKQKLPSGVLHLAAKHLVADDVELQIAACQLLNCVLLNSEGRKQVARSRGHIVSALENALVVKACK